MKKSLLDNFGSSLGNTSLFEPSFGDKKPEKTDYSGRDYVYFIQKGLHGPIKIGVSVNPSKRLKTLQTACTEQLHLLGTYKASYNSEAELHQLFASTHIRGEWFECTDELLDKVYQLTGKRLCQKTHGTGE